jgi:UDP-glucose 4-epimerase
MKVLVAGGAGYIGSHCVRQLQLAGHTPFVVDNLAYGHRAALSPVVTFHNADIGDRDTMEKILREEQPDAVMHFAAFCYVGESVQKPMMYYQNNVVATLNLLDAMLAAGVSKFIFSSTCATYGEPEKLPMAEDTPQAPINPYGNTKLAVEFALRDMATAGQISFAAFRYFNASGAAEDGSIGEDHDPETHLIPLAIQAATGQRPPLKIFGQDYHTPDGTCLRDYIHVDDLSRAHILALDKLSTTGTALAYNLGSGTPNSVREVIDTVARVTGKPVPHETASRRQGDPPALYADSSKAQTELGWKPKFRTLEPIIETAWKWHMDHPDGYAGS